MIITLVDANKMSVEEIKEEYAFALAAYAERPTKELEKTISNIMFGMMGKRLIDGSELNLWTINTLSKRINSFQLTAAQQALLIEFSMDEPFEMYATVEEVVANS